VRSLNGDSFTPKTSCSAEKRQADYQGAIWKMANSRNFGSRDGETVKYITIHTIQGSYASAISWFQNANARVSAHYIIRSSDGQVTQMVCETDKAYHVRTDNATTIGLEHEGFIEGGSVWYTQAMYESSAALVRDICRRHGIDPLKTYAGPPTRGTRVLGNTCYHIKGHQHFRGNDHIDPGPFWDWERYYRLINGDVAPQVLSSRQGEFSDPGGAGNYPDQARVGYLIRPRNASSVTLRFLELSLEGTKDAPYDYLDIYDGENANGKFIGRFTGDRPPPQEIVARSGAMFIEFRSDCQVNQAGWRASYTSEERNPDCAMPGNLIAGDLYPMGVTLNWDPVPGTREYLVRVRRKIEPNFTVYRIRNNFLKLTGLAANGLYVWQVQTLCGPDTSAAAGESFLLPPIARSGSAQVYTTTAEEGRILDSGGAGSTYASEESWLYRIVPANGGRVELRFTEFNTEEGVDLLTVYDGLSTNAPQLAVLSGKPGARTFISSGNGLTVHFTSNNRNNFEGWAGTWRTLGAGSGTPPVVVTPDPPVRPPVTPAPDPQPPAPAEEFGVTLEYPAGTPETRIEAAASYSGSFTLNFRDGAENYRFYTLASNTDEGWRGNPEAGFLTDEFDRSLSPAWRRASGTWRVSGQRLRQSETTPDNTNLHTSLTQTGEGAWLYHWQARMSGGAGNRRHGLHFFCSDPAAENRGNSYFVWIRDTEREDFAEIYETVDNQFSMKARQPLSLRPGQTCDYKVYYDPSSGLIELYVNQVLAVSWTDPSPLRSGRGISLRTGGCEVLFDNLMVYRSRSGAAAVQPQRDLPGLGRFRAVSLVMDGARRWSRPAVAESAVSAQAGPSVPPNPNPNPNPGPGPATGSLRPSYAGDFLLNFGDTGGGTGFFLPADHDGQRWSANRSLGYLLDEFPGSRLNPEWTSAKGSWQVRNGVLQQQDAADPNTNLFIPLTQTGTEAYLYHFRVRLLSTAENSRFGLHFFCSDGGRTNRGDSYLVWFRYQVSAPSRVEVYRSQNDALPRFRSAVNLTLTPSTWLDCRVMYDPRTGQVDAWINSQRVLTWRDETAPLRAGSAVSLRTGSARVEFDDLRVYKQRGADPVRITVGSGADRMLRFKSMGGNPAARIYSVLLDARLRWQAVKQEETRIE
jgi:N-acetyl-anhydromuramyl-L-alanine amidase AmpD